MSELPFGWAKASLGEVSDYGAPKQVSPAHIDDSAWILELEDIERDSSKLLHRLTFAERQSKSNKSAFASGDILYGKLRPYLNKVVIADSPGYCTTEIVPISPSNGIESKWVFYVLTNPTFIQYVSTITRGINMPRLTTESARRVELPVPPSNEQRRIVAKLDALFAKSRAIRDKLDRVPRLLANLKKSILNAAYRGDLTREWRTENGQPEWTWSTVGQVVSEPMRNGYSARPVDYATPYRVLTLTATTSGFFKAAFFKYFDDEVSDDSPFWLRKGDVLVQRGNTHEYVGVSAIYDGEDRRFIYPDLMMRLRAGQSIIPEYLWLVLLTEPSRAFMRERATGTAGNMPKINQTTLGSVPIPLPSKREQSEIVRISVAALSCINALQGRIGTLTDRLSATESSLLLHAFRGELVPQDPNDEPASVLLERIRAERAAAGPSRRTRTKRLANST
jgi:type I restriction enzyme S subunit